jgi:hypothetical protein
MSKERSEEKKLRRTSVETQALQSDSIFNYLVSRFYFVLPVRLT